jgi:hypothetical protein
MAIVADTASSQRPVGLLPRRGRRVQYLGRAFAMATDVNALSRLLQSLAERRWEHAVTLDDRFRR